MTELPSGTVTFLFTDVEGSTRLLDELGDAFADVLADHRRVLREAFARHGGVEVDTQGDAFFVAFARASDALAAAREATEALDGPIRVRIGVHTGEPLVTGEGYVGIDVHRAARIAAAGHGGQILVSQATRDLAGVDELRDLGEHYLKDLSAPERIYQLGDGDFPPLKALYETNLPVQPTPLVGRERELGHIVDLVRSHRLVTLTGAGGSGKTRLALQVAAELVDEFADGVWFVSLAPLTDSSLVEPSIGSVVGAKGELEDFLAGKRMLLVLDNLEQLMPDVAAIVSPLPVKVVATSRERLNVYREQEYQVPTLPVDEAVALFTQRARLLKASFEPDEHVRAIAQRLDGLPLALELAAARVKVLTTEQIMQRLGHSLDLLTAGSYDMPERQRTLRATIDWSYRLLGDDEKRIFERLVVFPGSFELEAAERITGAGIDMLASLVDKSLLRQTDTGRFFMLATIREFAEQAVNGVVDALRRHAEYFAELADCRWSELVMGDSDWRLVVAAEQHNFHAALEWALENREGETALSLTSGIWPFWVDRGFVRQGERWLEAALALPTDQTSYRRAHSLAGLGDMLLFQGKLAGAQATMESAQALYRELDFPRGTAAVVTQLADVAALPGDLPRARRLAEEAMRIRRERLEGLGVGRSLITLGWLALADGDLDAAGKRYEEAIDVLRRDHPDGVFLPFALMGTGEVVRRRGDHRAAADRFKEALERAALLGDSQGVVEALDRIASLHEARGEAETAARLAGAAEALREQTGFVRLEPDRPPPERLEPAWSEGRKLTMDEAVELALRHLD